VKRILKYLYEQAHLVETTNITFNYFERNPGARLLDCGCNDGAITLKIASRIGTEDVWGIELIEDFAVKARGKGIKVIRGDLNKGLGIGDDSVDVVHAGNVIEHLYDTDFFLKEIYRVLRGRGYLVVSTCNLASWHNIGFLVVGRQPPAADISDELFSNIIGEEGYKLKGTGHRRIFTFDALHRLLEYHGFEVEEKLGAGYYPLPLILARLMCRADRNHSVYMVIKARKSK